MEDFLKKVERLERLTEHDEIYCVWKNSYDAVKREFEFFAANQSEKTYRMLWACIGSLEMMVQRKTVIVCEHMEFMREERG